MLMTRREHLTEGGLEKLVAIKASINKGLPDELKTIFPNVISTPRPLINNQKIPDPNWLAGFVSVNCIKFYYMINSSILIN